MTTQLLTDREVEVLVARARGMTNKQVAYALSITEQTVKNHIGSILHKLDVDNIVAAWLVLGWLRIPDDPHPAIGDLEVAILEARLVKLLQARQR